MTHPRLSRSVGFADWKQMRLYERSPVTWRRSQIGRPGKEHGAMEVQPLNQKYINTF